MRTFSRLILVLFFILCFLFIGQELVIRSAPKEFTTNLNSSSRQTDPKLTDLSIFEIGSDRFYNLASKIYNTISPNSKLIYVPAGLRKEQIIEILSTNLDLDQSARDTLSLPFKEKTLELNDGYIRPGFYLFSKPYSASTINTKFKQRFNREILSRYPAKTAEAIDLKKTLVIASLIEREASGSHDMPLISGVIWNRLDERMALDIDASLQYISGQSGNWWPRILTGDKKSSSPYNTYHYKTLPPEPISNPSSLSIMAALNPIKTDCLFYLHDKNRKIHCSKTYEEHKRMIKKYY